MTTVARSRGSRIARTWWKKTKRQPHEDVVGLVTHLRKKSRRDIDVFHMRLYGNYDVSGQGERVPAGASRAADGRVRYNLTASVIGTAASLVASSKPMPMYLTSDGDFGLQRKARLRTRVIEGQFWDLGVYDLGPRIFVDGSVLGTGVVYGCVHPVTGKPHLERVMPLELLVDHTEAIAGQPRSMYRVRLVAREVLEALYPSYADKIATAAGPSGDDFSDWFLNRDTTADQVLVYEAWHLPSGGTADDGRHVLCVDNCTLVDEPYTWDRFPFAWYRWEERQVGFWGMGLAERCADSQWRINQLIRRVERLQDLGSNGFVFLEGSSEVKAEQISNLPMQAIRYVGPPPTFYTHAATPPDLQLEIDRIKAEKLEEFGLSAQSVRGEKPSGVTSAVGQRAADDIQSRRHVQNAKRWEQFHMELAKLLEHLNDECAANDPSYTVRAIERRGRAEFLRETRWKSVSLGGENKSRMRVFPVSALPTTPQGKWSAVQEWIEAGFVSRPFAMQLMDFPDLDAAARIELADLDYVMWQVERMLDGEAVSPEPYQDIALAADIVRKSLLQADLMGAGDDVLQLFRDYLDEVKTTQDQAAAAQLPPAPGPAVPVGAGALGSPGPGLPGAMPAVAAA